MKSHLITKSTNRPVAFLRGAFAFLLCASVCVPAVAGTAAIFPSSDAAFRKSLADRAVSGAAALQVPLPAARPDAPVFPLVYAKSSGKITVGVNPNRELLYAILQLTKYSDQLRGRREEPVVAEARKQFAAFAGHPAVAELDYGGELNWEKGLGYDAFSAFPGYFSALPEGRRLYPYHDEFLGRVLWGASKEEKIAYLDAYWLKVMDFYRVSGFADFFGKHAAVYQAYVDNVYRNLPGTDPVKLHEDYHANRGFEHFYVVPSPLSLPTGGNYGWRLGSSIFNFMGYGFDDPYAVNHLILHEFGHSFCNPVAEKYEEQLAAYAGLMDGLRADMEAQAYGNWQTVMYELLVRSVHARLVLKTEGKEAAELFLLDNAVKRKFVFIGDFYELLGEYERDRGRYPTLYEFYPRLAQTLAGWELAEVDEAGDPGVWSAPVESGLYVTGLDTKTYGYAAGLRWGDIVTSAEGVKPASSFFLKLVPGRAYALSVTRKDGTFAVVSLVVPSQKKLRPVKKSAALTSGR